MTKPVGEPGAGSPPVRFDYWGWETELRRMAQDTAPILDSTKASEAKASNLRQLLGGQRKCMGRLPRLPSTRMPSRPGRSPARSGRHSENGPSVTNWFREEGLSEPKTPRIRAFRVTTWDWGTLVILCPHVPCSVRAPALVVSLHCPCAAGREACPVPRLH